MAHQLLRCCLADMYSLRKQLGTASDDWYGKAFDKAADDSFEVENGILCSTGITESQGLVVDYTFELAKYVAAQSVGAGEKVERPYTCVLGVMNTDVEFALYKFWYALHSNLFLCHTMHQPWLINGARTATRSR